jgi:oligopeptide transport system substrate-binding protein
MPAFQPARTRFTGGSAGLILLLAACGGSAASPSAPAGSGSSAAPTRGGTLSIAYQSDIATLDPTQGYDVVSWPAERLIFETLITYGKQTDLVPQLATDMPAVSNGGRTYTFTIRDGVNFVKRDGSILRPMTADDVVFSFNRLLDPKLKPNPSPVASSFFQVIEGAAAVTSGKAKEATGVKKVDEHNVSFTIVQPDRTFLFIMAMPFASIVPKDLAGEDTTAFSADPVGTGPFLLTSYDKGQSAKFARNPHYWEAGQPSLDGIDFRVGVDPTSALQQVEAGSLDVMGDAIPPGSFTSVVNDPQYKTQIKSILMVSTWFLSLDTSAPNSPLSKVEVRRAIEYAIDKENVLAIWHGAGTVANCIFPPNLFGYDASCKPYSYDPDKAKKMLANAGYPNGFSTHIFSDTTDPDPAVAQAIQQDLAKVGIKADLTSQSFETFLGTITVPHKAPLVWVGWFQDFPDPSDFYEPILSCATNVAGNFNLAWYCNQEVEKLEAAAKGEQDDTKRVDAYQQVQKMVMNDAPWVPVFHQKWFTVISKRVTNFELHPVWLYNLRTYAVSS